MFKRSKRCYNCGAEIFANWNFCSFCGRSLNPPGIGKLVIGGQEFSVYIHPEFSTSDIEFKDGAGNILVTIKNVT